MNFEQLRVLIVDDLHAMRMIIKRILLKQGVRFIDEAADGTTAYDLIHDNPYNLILLDWNMPRMSGIDLLTALRNEDTLKRIPVLMVTAEAQESQIIVAVQAGATDYIVKPFTEETLVKKVRTIIKGHPEMEKLCSA